MEAGKMGVLGFALFLVTLWTVSTAEDAIYFPLAPDSVTFNTADTLHSSEVANALSAMLAYTMVKPSAWQSLGPMNPLKRPEGIFVLDILGVPADMDITISGEKFLLENQNDLDGQYPLLTLRTNKRFAHQSPIMLKFDAGDELYSAKSEQTVLFKGIPADSEGRLEKAKEDSELGRAILDGTFNTTFPADALFLLELETVKLLLKGLSANKATVNDGVPDIFWVQLKGLHGIVKEYGTDSNQAKEAVRLTEQVITEIVTTMGNIYPNRAVVAVILETSLPYSISRKTRDILQASTAAPEVKNGTIGPLNPGNLAYFFDNDFHVSFALTAFTTIFLILTVLGVSVGMWFMDPGRDSIIYRMTSQRKKD